MNKNGLLEIWKNFISMKIESLRKENINADCCLVLRSAIYMVVSGIRQ